MENKIKLVGHDNSIKWLEEIKENEYKLCGELIEYSRFGVDTNDDSYKFIDPPGGPMMYIDELIPGSDKIVKEICIINNDIILKTY